MLELEFALLNASHFVHFRVIEALGLKSSDLQFLNSTCPANRCALSERDDSRSVTISESTPAQIAVTENPVLSGVCWKTIS